ncbi:MAG: GWxTD domain-containing protein [Candidatus Cloacimonetes bacterium]|jgi:GWxTD domain-containing protein|nr:GWxTD domain-containing protein [Candidatus Cloacimonadota bacterium]MDY0367168.1 GWxTD domain-containing protein [Candidatus Syntrophosphaera sp.]HOY84673.1 GWxTD domain-containing protein [Candidatus Syntrophosphaera sp.]
MKNIRALLLCLALTGLGAAAAAETFTMHVAPQRFLNKDNSTILNVDYQIPYGNLWFLAQKGGYFAELDLQVEVVVGDSVVYSQTYRDNIGISDKNDSRSNKSYLNRLTFSLNSEPWLLRVSAKDLNSRKTANWTYQAEPLGAQDLLSDLELCSFVRPDSSSYLQRFHRGNVLYQTQPSLIFDKTESEDLTIYFETYAPADLAGDTGLLVLTVEKDSVMVFDRFLDYAPLSHNEGISLRIPLEKLSPGKYTGSVEFQLGEQSQEREFIFFLTEPKQEQFFVFPDPDDDFKLLKYFTGATSTADWKTYDLETKRRYLSQSWKALAAAGAMNTQTLLDQIRERVDYANSYYSHFEQGWTSDMGRIHIRQGKPDEIEKGTSSDEARFVRKDYQIWKYQGRQKAVYLFLDMQMNGNSRLIYVEGDQRESSNPDYLYYLGDDFDTSKLYN